MSARRRTHESGRCRCGNCVAARQGFDAPTLKRKRQPKNWPEIEFAEQERREELASPGPHCSCAECRVEHPR